MLLWQGYPNVGADARNVFDLLRSLPGGIAGVRSMVDDFHRRNVRVLCGDRIPVPFKFFGV